MGGKEVALGYSRKTGVHRTMESLLPPVAGSSRKTPLCLRVACR